MDFKNRSQFSELKLSIAEIQPFPGLLNFDVCCEMRVRGEEGCCLWGHESDRIFSGVLMALLLCCDFIGSCNANGGGHGGVRPWKAI